MAGPATVEALGLPFAEAIAYLRDKVDLPTERWTDLWHGMHARAFVVAGAATEALVSDFHGAAQTAIAEGRTLADFRRDFSRITAQHGWDFRGGRRWRAGVIFNTNLRMAYAAGKWAQIERLAEARPWLRYVAVLDDATRPDHRQWHDTILPIDDPFWSTHYPPNGWGCRCTVQQLADEDLERMGLRPSTRAPAVEVQERDLRGLAGGPEVEVPKGIDTGFAYNVGHAAWGRGAHRKLLSEADRRQDLMSPGVPQVPRKALPALPVDRPRGARMPDVDERDPVAIRQAFRRALGGPPDQPASAIWVDPTGARIEITEALVDHILAKPERIAGRVRYFGLLQEAIEAPAEVWVSWTEDKQTGQVGLRRRYVKQVDIGGGRFLGVVIDARQRQWEGLTFVLSERGPGVGGMRKGLLLHRRKD